MRRLLNVIGTRRGQATTEVVLLFPVFMLIVFVTAKIFALLVLVQKLEISSYYAARRWQLESHKNSNFFSNDEAMLQVGRSSIKEVIKSYIGFNDNSVRGFLNLKDLQISVVRTQVWQVMTITVTTNPAGVKLLCRWPKAQVCSGFKDDCGIGYDYLCVSGGSLETIKYIPNRDRPIQFQLPGLQ